MIVKDRKAPRSHCLRVTEVVGSMLIGVAASMTNIELGNLRESVVLSDISLPKIDIKFEDLGYKVESRKVFIVNIKKSNEKGNETVILEGVTGEFSAGQVSAIMGPSGSGKVEWLSSSNVVKEKQV